MIEIQESTLNEIDIIEQAVLHEENIMEYQKLENQRKTTCTCPVCNLPEKELEDEY